MLLKNPCGYEVRLSLSSLSNGRRGISPSYASALIEAASYCIERACHPNPTIINIQCRYKVKAEVFRDSLDQRAEATWMDDDFATEQGAYCIAALLVEVFGLEVIRRSRKGTGFDYWLGEPDDSTFLYQNLSRLEVSGIRSGSQRVINNRSSKKVIQTKKTDVTNLPAVIVVVEFGKPIAKITER